MKLNLNKNQVWLVSKALLEFTSDEGILRLLDEYPNADLEALVEDVNDVITQLEQGHNTQ